MNERENWKIVRQRLLTLHKVLLDRERAHYEKEHEAIPSPGAFLQLVLGHEQFAWLRQLSGLIVQFDEALSLRKPATLEQGEALLAEARVLMQTDSPDDFSRRLRAALTDTPEAAAIHRELFEDSSSHL